MRKYDRDTLVVSRILRSRCTTWYTDSLLTAPSQRDGLSLCDVRPALTMKYHSPLSIIIESCHYQKFQYVCSYIVNYKKIEKNMKEKN